MPSQTLLCPSCKKGLQTPSNLPGNAVIKCPNCRASLRTPASPPANAIPPQSRPPIDKAALAASAQGAVLSAGAKSVGKRLLIVVLVLLALSGASIGLLAWVLNRDAAAPTQAKGPNDDLGSVEIPEPVVKKTLKKTAKKEIGAIDSLVVLKPDEAKKVDEMVAKGIGYLKRTQNPDGSWGSEGEQKQNYSAFAGLTLLECGVSTDDPSIQKAAAFIRQQAPAVDRVYPLALILLFLEKLGQPQDQPDLLRLSMQLIATQSRQGGWNYGAPCIGNADARALADLVKKETKNILAQKIPHDKDLAVLPAAVKSAGIFFDSSKEPSEFFRDEKGGDNSNTQFALLGLWAARRSGVPVDAAITLVVRRFRNIQNDNGSFSYRNRTVVSIRPSMTCAGLLGLAAGYGLADKKSEVSPLKDAAIQSALAHVTQAVGSPGNTAMDDMYFVWSVERVAVLYQLKDFGGKDWYRWGLEMLAAHQQGDHWHAPTGHGASPLVDTCFALLFLQRANLTEDLTDKLTEFGGPAASPAISSKK